MENQIIELTKALSICLSEITQLKELNQKQAQQITSLTQTIHVFSQSLSEIIGNLDYLNQAMGEQNIFATNATTQLERLEQCITNVKYEVLAPNINPDCYFYPHIIDSSTAIEKIVHEHKSIARFGDGEFSIMMNTSRHSFQKADVKLAERLCEVLHSDHPDLLVAIADNYGALDKYNANGALGIRLYMTDEVRSAHQQLLDPDREYYDAYMSRPYALFKDNQTDAPLKRFRHLQQIWQDRDVIFVEGSLTRLGVGNNLFENARSIRRIIAPPTNSFDRYDDILQTCLNHATEDILFLLAIGPSAGVLAYDLCQNGHQAVDIGHVDLEYEWFLQGTGGRCEVPTKYNNELPDGDIVEDINDPQYTSQIICSFA